MSEIVFVGSVNVCPLSFVSKQERESVKMHCFVCWLTALQVSCSAKIPIRDLLLMALQHIRLKLFYCEPKANALSESNQCKSTIDRDLIKCHI